MIEPIWVKNNVSVEKRSQDRHARTGALGVALSGREEDVPG
jgi:hypothetical protein